MKKEINYTLQSKMMKGFPKITKLGAVSPNDESSPFVFQGRLYRLELIDPSVGLDRGSAIEAIIRDRETGEILSRFGQDCYYHSVYVEGDTVYVVATLSKPPKFSGDTIMLFESRDLIHWSRRELLRNPGWDYYNTSLTKTPDGYMLLMEAREPEEEVGVLFTCFFASSPDLKTWTFMDYAKGYPKHRYIGGPWLRWSRGYYYLIGVTLLPCERFTNYIYRTKDFDTWEVGFYNPILMPDEEDRKLSPYAFDFTPDFLREIRTAFITSDSDVDLCDWNGKTLLSYNVGNQHGFCYIAEAEYDGCLEDFLAAYFE